MPALPKGWLLCEVCLQGAPWREVSKTKRAYHHPGRDFPCVYRVPKEEWESYE